MAANDGGNGAPANAGNGSVITYHCLCTHLVMATNITLANMPKRQVDAAATSTTGSLATTLTMPGLSTDDKAMILKLEDGFEKRYPVRCSRCGLMAGYQLDKSQFAGTEEKTGPNAEVLYVLPGGLMTTEEMRGGKDMEREIGVVASI